MRLLITTDTVGGVWTFCQELTRGLLVQGSAVALVSLGPEPNPENVEQCRRLQETWPEDFQYTHIDAPLEWMQNNKSAYSAVAAPVGRMAKEFEAELIHSNQFCLGKLDCSLPVVVTAHSDVLSWAENCRGEELAESEWLTTYCSLVQEGLLAADALIAPTRWMLSALGHKFKLPSNAHVIYNGRSLRNVPASSRKLLQAITVGRLWDEAKAISILAEISSPVPILVAGDMQHEGSHMSARDRSGRVRYLGRLAEEQVIQYLSESAIYICSSRYEPFGLAPLEAALCGCAVVARNIASLREVWAESAAYFDDCASLERILQNFADDSESLTAAQARSFQRATKYSAARMTREYLDLYSALTAGVVANAAQV